MTLETSNNPVDGRTWTIAIWALYIGSFITGITALVGIVLAYVKRADMAGTPFESHITSAIRTFWIGLIGMLISGVLMIVLIGFVTALAVAVWVIFRSVRGLIYAIDSKPIPDPQGWL